MKVAITGHRPNKLNNDYDLKSDLILSIKKRIIQELDILIKEHPKVICISGMALGIDTLFAQIAIELNLEFIAAIPCQQQHKMWAQRSKEIYLDLINHPLCFKYYVSEGEYSPQKMQIRNEWMVDHCDLLIAVWDGTSGGTKNCIDYALKKNKLIIRINPKDYEKNSS